MQKSETKVDFPNDSLWKRFKENGGIQIVVTILIIFFIAGWFNMRERIKARDICSDECRSELGDYGSFSEYERCVSRCVDYWMKPPDI